MKGKEGVLCTDVCCTHCDLTTVTMNVPSTFGYPAGHEQFRLPTTTTHLSRLRTSIVSSMFRAHMPVH